MGSGFVTTHTAATAFRRVLDYAGCSNVRDAVDSRVVSETDNGNYTYKGSNGGTNGIIDSQTDVGGWPSYAAGTAETDMSNPDLKWETTISNNIGLDFGLFKDRIDGSIEVYQNNTEDLLIKFPTAGSGYDNQYRNIGSTRNRGVELTLNGVIFERRNFGMNASFNIAYNRNQVTSLGGLDQIEATSYWASTEIGTDYLVQVGQPLGNMYAVNPDTREFWPIFDASITNSQGYVKNDYGY